MKKLAIFLALALLAGQAAAAPSGSLTGAHPLLGDMCRPNRPFAIGVPVFNGSPQTQSCKVSVSDNPGAKGSVTGETRVELASGSRHLIPLLIPMALYQFNVDVEMGGSSIQPVTLTPNWISQQDLLATVLSPVGTEFAYLAGYKSLVGAAGELRVNHPDLLSPAPTSFWSYLSSDIIVVYELPRLNLGPEVLEALVDWTRLGGTLVLVSEHPEAEYKGTPLADICPHGAAAPLVGEFSLKLSVRKGELPAPRVAPLNEGQVILIPTPVVDQKKLGPDQTQLLWKAVVDAYHTDCPFASLRFEQVLRLAHPAELPKPSAAGIAWYLVIYVLAVIPINYWLLRRRDKMLWLIVTVPALSIVIAGISFGLNAVQHGSETVLRELGLAVISNGSSVAVSDHSLMLFSPATARYELGGPKNSYFRPQEVDTGAAYRKEIHLVSENDNFHYRDINIPMWSLARFRSDGLHPLDGPVVLQVEPSAPKTKAKTYTLKVENRSGVVLNHCRYWDGSNYSQSFDLGQGSNHIQAEMQSLTPAEALDGDTVAADDRSSLAIQMEHLMKSGLLGWSSDPRLASGLHVDRPCKSLPMTLVLVPQARASVRR